jgi:hypothetical protein
MSQSKIKPHYSLVSIKFIFCSLININLAFFAYAEKTSCGVSFAQFSKSIQKNLRTGIALNFEASSFDALIQAQATLLGKKLGVVYHEGFGHHPDFGGPMILEWKMITGTIESVNSRFLTINNAGQMIPIERQYIKDLRIMEPKKTTLSEAKTLLKSYAPNPISIAKLQKATLKLQFDRNTQNKFLEKTLIEEFNKSLKGKTLILVSVSEDGLQFQVGTVEQVTANQITLNDGARTFRLRRSKVVNSLLP